MNKKELIEQALEINNKLFSLNHAKAVLDCAFFRWWQNEFSIQRDMSTKELKCFINENKELLK